MRLPASSPLSASALLLCGFVGWSLAFVALYALLSFGCAYGWDGVAVGPVSLNRAVLVGAWALTLLFLGAILAGTMCLFTAADGRTARFLKQTGIALSALAFAATAWNFFMVATLSTCL